jgi:hypothetical protein
MHVGGVHHPLGLSQFAGVPQLMTEQRQPRIRLGIELQRHAHVAEAAGGRQELRGGRRIAEQTAALQVDDQIRHGQPLEERAERGRLLGPANDRGRQRRVVHAQERRRHGLGVRGNDAEQQQQRGDGERAAQGWPGERTSRQRYDEMGRVHDVSPIQPHGPCGTATSSWTWSYERTGSHCKRRTTPPARRASIAMAQSRRNPRADPNVTSRCPHTCRQACTAVGATTRFCGLPICEPRAGRATLI